MIPHASEASVIEADLTKEVLQLQQDRDVSIARLQRELDEALTQVGKLQKTLASRYALWGFFTMLARKVRAHVVLDVAGLLVLLPIALGLWLLPVGIGAAAAGCLLLSWRYGP